MKIKKKKKHFNLYFYFRHIIDIPRNIAEIFFDILAKAGIKANHLSKIVKFQIKLFNKVIRAYKQSGSINGNIGVHVCSVQAKFIISRN